MKDNLIKEKAFQFSLSIVNLYVSLKKENEYVISKQLLRSGTSIGANIEEAVAAQSKKDFLSKMSISSKEARETKYWLMLLKQSNISNINCSKYLIEIDNIINILTKIVKTTSKSL